MTAVGFNFRYRLSGLPPSLRNLACADAGGLVPGDMASFDAGAIRLAVTGDMTMLGCVVDSAGGGATDVGVIADEDAVYAVVDLHARRARAKLDLTGRSGAQRVTSSVNGDFEVVAASAAEEETLLRIALGRHWAFASAVPYATARAPGATLTPERERWLVMAAAAGDKVACEELVEAFLPAVAAVARLYRGSATVDRAELLQAGVVGLLRAIKRFDPSFGNQFWAYASWWVRQAMQQLVSELTRPAVLSDRAQRDLMRIRQTHRLHVQTHGREPSTDELAALAGLPRKQVEQLLAVERAPLPLVDDDTDGVAEDALPDPAAEDEYERVLAALEFEQVRDLTAVLSLRERTILVRHYGLDGPPRTLRELGADLGVSAERVRQIEEQALEKLRVALLQGPDSFPSGP